MMLFNCVTPREIELKEISLLTLTKDEKQDLVNEIVQEFFNGDLCDENIVIEALRQIALSI